MRLYECARCSFQFGLGSVWQSKHTKSWFCRDQKNCDRRFNNDLTNAEIVKLGNQTLKEI